MTAVRVATCGCGRLRATCTGEPARVSVCHCLDCQRRSGSAFAARARWPDERVRLEGDWREWVRVGDDGGTGTFRFCPTCGGTVAYVVSAMPGIIAVALGGFADPAFPAPAFSMYEDRRHPWVAVVGDGVAHD